MYDVNATHTKDRDLGLVSELQYVKGSILSQSQYEMLLLSETLICPTLVQGFTK